MIGENWIAIISVSIFVYTFLLLGREFISRVLVKRPMIVYLFAITGIFLFIPLYVYPLESDIVQYVVFAYQFYWLLCTTLFMFIHSHQQSVYPKVNASNIP